MSNRLVNLLLVMKELGLDCRIDTIEQRVSFQKAIYLAQAVGVPLHYPYSWYVHGPYSPDLTRDYYALHESMQASLAHAERLQLRADVGERLRKLAPAVHSPTNERLTENEWLELMASVHYLKTVYAFDDMQTRERLDQLKPHVAEHTGQAISKLKEIGLI